MPPWPVPILATGLDANAPDLSPCLGSCRIGVKCAPRGLPLAAHDVRIALSEILVYAAQTSQERGAPVMTRNYHDRPMATRTETRGR